jgi:hypothetical protein
MDLDQGGRQLAGLILDAAGRGQHYQVADLIAPLDAEQLRSLATVLAVQVDQSAPASSATGPAAVCELAINAAAPMFGTTPEAILSAERSRPVSDARAVAMTAARETGQGHRGGRRPGRGRRHRPLPRRRDRAGPPIRPPARPHRHGRLPAAPARPPPRPAPLGGRNGYRTRISGRQPHRRPHDGPLGRLLPQAGVAAVHEHKPQEGNGRGCVHHSTSGFQDDE